MSQLPEFKLKDQLDIEYQKLDATKPREYADICYGIIGIKKGNQLVERYRRSLYNDVKHFLMNYLQSFETEDYGYDIPNEVKVKDAIDALPRKESLAMYRYARVLYEERGYDTAFIERRVNQLKTLIALNEKHYLKFLLQLSSYNVWTLLLSYLLFVCVVLIILLPAPFECFSILDVNLHEFAQSAPKNYLLNTLAIVSGSDYGQTVVPTGARGMLLIIVGKIFFYLLIANFILKKLEDYFTID